MKFKKLLACGIATSILFSTYGGAVSAATYKSPTIIQHQQSEVDQLAGDLEVLFTEYAYLDGDRYVLDTELAAAYFGQENIAALSAFIKLVNGEQLTEEDLIGIPAPAFMAGSNGTGMISANSWASCVGDRILEFTGIGFLSGGMWELIEKKNWDLLAKELVKVAGKNAIKGGAVGLAASLAWFSVACL